MRNDARANATEFVYTWKGKPLDSLTDTECREALTTACHMLHQQREHVRQQREMEQLFDETRRALKTGFR